MFTSALNQATRGRHITLDYTCHRRHTVAISQYMDTTVLTTFAWFTIASATAKLDYISARANASLPHGTRHRVTRPIISCSTRPDHRHENEHLIKKKSAISETVFYDAVFLASPISQRFSKNIAMGHVAIRVAFVSHSFVIIAMNHAAVRVKPVSPQHCDVKYRNTHRALFQTPTLTHVFTISNTQTVWLPVWNDVEVKLRSPNGRDSRDCWPPLHRHLFEIAQSGAIPLNATYSATKTATFQILTQLPRRRLSTIFTYLPTTTSV